MRPPPCVDLGPQVSVLDGALDCWVFLSCLEVLHRIEGCCDQVQLAANCSHTVGLWAYATDKVVTLNTELRCFDQFSLFCVCSHLNLLHSSALSSVLFLCPSPVEVPGGALRPYFGERTHL